MNWGKKGSLAPACVLVLALFCCAGARLACGGSDQQGSECSFVVWGLSVSDAQGICQASASFPPRPSSTLARPLPRSSSISQHYQKTHTTQRTHRRARTPAVATTHSHTTTKRTHAELLPRFTVTAPSRAHRRRRSPLSPSLPTHPSNDNNGERSSTPSPSDDHPQAPRRPSHPSFLQPLWTRHRRP